MAASRRTDWPTLALLLAMYLVLVGNFVWYRLAPLPLLAPRRDRGGRDPPRLHDLARGRAPQRVAAAWLNDAVGVLGMLPYMTPFFLQRWIHLEHHALLNEREDPNFIYTDGPFWTLPLRYPRALRLRAQAAARRSAPARRALLGPPARSPRSAALFALAWLVRRAARRALAVARCRSCSRSS